MFLAHFTALHVLGRSNRKMPRDSLQCSSASVTANFKTESTVHIP